MASSPISDAIRIRGAREHNLKNLDVTIPKRKIVVFTGVSGSGKSSLAFDTLYAEGQRRYVESLSSYARQFLGQMDKPKYDTIRGLSPTISIEQKTASSNPRSTVGTVTEIHDYLRVLYASIGVQHCHRCGARARGQSPLRMIEDLYSTWPGAEVLLLAPLERQRKGEHQKVLAELAKAGFTRVRLDGKILRLDGQLPTLDKKRKHDIDLVLDRVRLTADNRARVNDSVEQALREGKGQLVAVVGEQERSFSRDTACPRCSISFPELAPQSFSFNSPLGFCSDCNGLGARPEMDPNLVVPRPELSIRDGAIALWAPALARGEGWVADSIEWIADTFGIDLDKPWNKLSAAQKQRVLYGAKRRGEQWEGLLNQLMRRLKATTSEEMKSYYLRFFSQRPCAPCEGTRLRPESRAVRIGDTSIDRLSRLRIDAALAFVEGLELSDMDARVTHELRREIAARLGFLVNVGLSYLSLDRASATLSGGESQRIRLASQIGSELTGVIYILDEPSIGLHQRDNQKLIATLESLRDLDNSVIVVEHDGETMLAADHLIDFGPGAGELGGEVVAEGTPAEVMAHPASLTGAYLSGRKTIPVPERRRAGNGHTLSIIGAAENNLDDIDVHFPLGTFVAVSGVSGAGKSTLINGVLYPALVAELMGERRTAGRHLRIEGVEHIDKIIAIDQRPIGRTPRSNPATYTKVFDAIRDLYAATPEARAFGFGAGRFSFNVKGGRCEACAGDGVRQVEMHFLPDVYVTCDECHGRRFNEATLRVTYKGKTIADTLAMSVREGLEQFAAHPAITRGLKTLADVGLGYLQIGQPSPTLSGGEAQRIKLARELSRASTGRTLYVLDEPTTGLHFADVERLLSVLSRLVDAGNTVIVIEHNLDVIKNADWVIDMGPEGGSGGGTVVAEGTPEHVAGVSASHTGRFLAEVLDLEPAAVSA